MSDFTEAERHYIRFLKDKMDGFTGHLFRAIASADRGNREKLRTAFPEEVAAHEAYSQGDLYERARAAGEWTWDTEKSDLTRKRGNGND